MEPLFFYDGRRSVGRNARGGPVTAAEILRADGHTSNGRCEKCWREAAWRYAGGQGEFESHTAAYYAVMDEAQRAAEREAATGPLMVES